MRAALFAFSRGGCATARRVRAALLDAEKLIVQKTARDGVTVAVAAEHWEVRFG